MAYMRFPDTLQSALLNHFGDAPKARLHTGNAPSSASTMALRISTLHLARIDNSIAFLLYGALVQLSGPEESKVKPNRQSRPIGRS